MRQHYTEEEANEILRRAVERQVGAGGMSRTQLEAIAGEIGVSPEALDRAEEEWEVEREDGSLRAAFEAEQRAQFRSHLISYIGVNLFLFLINSIVTPGFWWVLFPMLGWGLGLFFHGMTAYGFMGHEREQEFQRWLASRPEGRAMLQQRAAGSRRLVR